MPALYLTRGSDIDFAPRPLAIRAYRVPPPQVPDPADCFHSTGLLGPTPLFTPAQCALLARRYRLAKLGNAAEWPKGLAIADGSIYEAATSPAILKLLEPLLGADIVLWGASFVRRAPGRIHAWHTDMESAAPEGGFVSLWVGIRNTSRESALQLIAGSHRYGVTIQELEHRLGSKHGSLDAGTALAWAKTRDPEAAISQLAMSDGDGVFFDGRMWHGSHNRREAGVRLALLLQYARASVAVYAPQSHFGWPFIFAADRPPVLAVKGVPDMEANRVVEPPARRRIRARLREKVCPLELPLAGRPGHAWTPHRMFAGSTPTHDFIGAHASVLDPGHSPHPPHCHIEEEILVVLDGKADIMVGGPDPEVACSVAMPAGSFVYYPAWQFHTIRNASDAPVSYLMFKWRSAAFAATAPLGAKVHHTAVLSPPPGNRPGQSHRVLRLMAQPTSFLGRLHAHLTEMDPGHGYDAHRDRYDVAIIVFSGKLDTGGEVIGPGTVLYYAAGVLHGLRNVGEQIARYLVIEFEHRAATADRKRRREAKAAGQQIVGSTA